MRTEIFVYDAFTDKPGKGNPAGVVFDAGGMTDDAMQETAKKLGFNESVFILRETDGGLRFRYFTPGHEVPVCGHATVAGAYALAERGIIRTGMHTIRTGAGELPVSIRSGERFEIGMTQIPYREQPFSGSLESLARSIGLNAEALDTRYPVCYASTGLWTLLVPVRRLADFERMRPQTAAFPSVLTENERASIHPFCLETYRADCEMHGRHFSSPFSGTVEDPVTGTASGAMGAYFKRHIGRSGDELILRVEQGNEIGREGTVTVHVPADPDAPVTICGTAVFTEMRQIEI